MGFQESVGPRRMFRVLDCVAHEHDLRLVALSALICVLGCLTTTTLIARATIQRTGRRRTLALAAAVFGLSVWSLHFVAMLAFLPTRRMTYALDLTILSALVAVVGAFGALLVWQSSAPGVLRVIAGGLLLGLAVTGMHYVGIDAMAVSSLLSFDPLFVAGSVLSSMLLFTVGLVRSTDLRSASARLECAGWMTLAICSLHFTGMAAITVVPLAPTAPGGVLASISLAVAIGGIAVAILIVGLAATMIEHHLSQRTAKELASMRLMGNLAQEVLLIHRDGIVVEVNSAGERLFKAPFERIVGQPVLSMFAHSSLPALLDREQRAPCDRRPEEMEFKAADGTAVPVELSCKQIDYMGKLATAVSLRDLTNGKRDEARILRLARHDALTGLFNRHALIEHLDAAMATASRDGTVLALGFIDLDRFKPVNDLHGHAIGDAVLIQVGNRIRAELRQTDILARIGGDEFIMLVPTDIENVPAVASRINDALRQPFQIEGREIDIGASIGVALYPGDGDSADALIGAADAAMYRAKEEGRGKSCFFEAAMKARLQSRLQLEQELAGAAERGEMILLYQPIVSGHSGELENFEALIRWNNPRCGVVSPAEFIPLAEKTGLIGSIGRWVIETACREAGAWPKPWRVSINVSPRQMHSSDLLDVIGTALQENCLEPDRLVVEVTESVLIEDTAKAVAMLTQLRALGIRIALDDFGTGYSSLSYLQLFRFDKIKIDQSFIRKLGQSEDALILTRSIANLGRNLGLGVTAEGVETPSQLKLVRQLGCDHIQGYLIGRPATVEAYGPSEQRHVVELFEASSARVGALEMAIREVPNTPAIQTDAATTNDGRGAVHPWSAQAIQCDEVVRSLQCSKSEATFQRKFAMISGAGSSTDAQVLGVMREGLLLSRRRASLNRTIIESTRAAIRTADRLSA